MSVVALALGNGILRRGGGTAAHICRRAELGLLTGSRFGFWKGNIRVGSEGWCPPSYSLYEVIHIYGTAQWCVQCCGRRDRSPD